MKFTTGNINIPVNDNTLLQKIVDRINNHKELKVLWKINNVNAVDRLGMSDHGYTHFQIVANIALRICRLLREASIEMSIVKNYEFSFHHAEVVIFLASVLHDIGMSINREGHEELSLFLAR